MSALTDLKFTDADFENQNVKALPDTINNQAAWLKARFDNVAENVIAKGKINDLITLLDSTAGAENIGAQVTGITGQTVQLILSALKALVDDCYTKAEADAEIGTETNTLVQDITINMDTGVITVTKKDGTSVSTDTGIEKIALDVYLDGTDFVLVLEDGTQQRVSLSSFIDTYTFSNTDTIAFTVTGTGNNKGVSATVRNNSITLAMLAVDAVTEIQTNATAAQQSAAAAQASKDAAAASANTAQAGANTATTKASEASGSAVLSQSYAKGGTGTRTGEDTDNAKFYKEQTAQASSTAVAAAQTATISADRAKSEADRAAEIVGGDYATRTELETGLAGKVDVVTGKGLSTNDYTTEEKTKLAGIAENANNYVHPATHSAQMIDETDARKFVTPAEKAAWNGKADPSDLITVTLPVASWVKDSTREMWTQAVTHSSIVNDVRIGISVDDDTQLALMDAGVTLRIDNNNGTATAKAFGAIPESNITVQLTLTPVEVVA